MSKVEHRTPIHVRWRDLDMLGHVNQAVYHEFLEEGRAGFLLTLGAGPFVVARVELDYRHEVRRDHGTVEVVVRMDQVGRTSVTLTHEVVLPDGTVAAEGRTILVAWDAEARRSRPIGDEERALLTRTR